MTQVGHNEMRFDITLGHIWPMVECGEVSMPILIRKIREAIIDVINLETCWGPPVCTVISTGGDGRREQPLHIEEIGYDFS